KRAATVLRYAAGCLQPMVEEFARPGRHPEDKLNALIYLWAAVVRHGTAQNLGRTSSPDDGIRADDPAIIAAAATSPQTGAKSIPFAERARTARIASMLNPAALPGHERYFDRSKVRDRIDSLRGTELGEEIEGMVTRAFAVRVEPPRDRLPRKP